jgi:hypothetical protein
MPKPMCPVLFQVLKLVYIMFLGVEGRARRFESAHTLFASVKRIILITQLCI